MGLTPAVAESAIADKATAKITARTIAQRIGGTSTKPSCCCSSPSCPLRSRVKVGRPGCALAPKPHVWGTSTLRGSARGLNTQADVFGWLDTNQLL